jgi:phage regulator Rha-like protein
MSKLIQSNIKTMSSLEISELTGKRHDNVKRLIESFSQDVESRKALIARPHSEVMQKEVNGRIYEYEVYIFAGEQGKLDSITVVAQLCPEFTAALVKRWYELENQSLKPQLPDFTNPVEAARAWADEVEAKLIAQKQLELAAPKVEYFDRVANVGNLMTASVVGKKIGMSAQVLNAHLQEMKVYDKRQKGRVFQQWFIDKGYGELKKTDNGYNQSKFTNKGEQWVIQKFTSEGII